MNLIDAIKSEKPFKRPHWNGFYCKKIVDSMKKGLVGIMYDTETKEEEYWGYQCSVVYQ